jgi:hypothetical protein
MNKNEHNVALTNQLESIKDINEPAYYQAQLSLLSKQVGWQHGQNTLERAAETQEKIKSLVPEALNAGLTPEQIESIYGSGFSAASVQNQTRIANDAAGTGSGFNLGELVRGIAPVAALAIGGPLLDAALAGGAAASGAGGSIGGINVGGAFTPVAGSGASFTLPAAAVGAGGSIGGIELGGAFTPSAGSGASFAVPGATGTTSLLGPTYGELGVPGVQQGLLGPTYGELGYTGLTEGLSGPTYGELGLSGLEVGTEASTGAPIFDSSQEVILSPGGNYIPANTLPSEIAGLDASILQAGEAAIKAAPSTISPLQAVNAIRGVSSLLGGGQTGTPAAATQQFRGSNVPQGSVDYSGILNLLQARSPQRNPYSLLG